MYRVLKRIGDVLLAFVMLFFLWPLILFIYILNFLIIRDNPLFTQRRIGYKNQEFIIYKFKSMNNDKDSDGNLLSDEERLTSFGKIIRSLSLDELPQLVNVLKGEMSFVGPRPLLPEYLPLYSKEQIKRHNVLPGITGWAQVNGRNAISWKKKFELDLYYVSNISFLLDVKIILGTVLKVVKRDDVSSDTSATMERFTGNN